MKPYVIQHRWERYAFRDCTNANMLKTCVGKQSCDLTRYGKNMLGTLYSRRICSKTLIECLHKCVRHGRAFDVAIDTECN